MYYTQTIVRACLHGVGDPGLAGLVSFVFTLWGTQNKRNLPHQTGDPPLDVNRVLVNVEWLRNPSDSFVICFC